MSNENANFVHPICVFGINHRVIGHLKYCCDSGISRSKLVFGEKINFFLIRCFRSEFNY